MKVFANNKVYVQNNDLMYLLRSGEDIAIPASIFERVFGKVFIVTSENGYDFVEFSEPDEIEFFNSCDWIVDYHSFDGMTVDEIAQVGTSICDSMNARAVEFNALPEEERAATYDKVNSQIELLNHKMLSVRDVIWYKQGDLKFPMPSDTGYNNPVDTAESNETKNNGIHRVLKLFRRDNNKNKKTR